MNQKQTDITTGKQIRYLRTQSGMTQEELAGELNVTRQALSNWERDVNEPDLNTLKKICFLFGVHMDDFAKEVITKMETCEKKEKRQFNKYDMAIGLFYGVGIFLGIGIFFVGGFMTMSGAGWGASLFGGGCFSLVFGLIALIEKYFLSSSCFASSSFKLLLLLITYGGLVRIKSNLYSIGLANVPKIELACNKNVSLNSCANFCVISGLANHPQHINQHICFCQNNRFLLILIKALVISIKRNLRL